MNCLKLRFMAIRFSIWDLHLYLDTHPQDAQAKRLLEQYEERYAQIKEEYEAKYGPLTPGGEGVGAAWLQDPWPWDYERGAC